jgi:hypothetical protein
VQLGEDDQVRPGRHGVGDGPLRAVGVRVDVPERGVDLRERDLHPAFSIR